MLLHSRGGPVSQEIAFPWIFRAFWDDGESGDAKRRTPSRPVCREYGVDVTLVDNVAEAFARVRDIEAAEGRTFVHPYEGPKTARGTATVGLEFIDQVRAAGEELDAVIVAAGGGGLTAGVACAVKLMSPDTAVYVVEPTGADTLARSFAAGSPQSIDAAHDCRLTRRAALRAVFVRAQSALRP
jgi:cysteine synthase